MTPPVQPSPSANDAAAAGRRFPAVSRVGAIVIAMGVLDDLVEHLGAPGAHPATGFSAGEHVAHLLVLVGMVVVLVGIVVDGSRAAGRHDRPGRSVPRALR